MGMSAFLEIIRSLLFGNKIVETGRLCSKKQVDFIALQALLPKVGHRGQKGKFLLFFKSALSENGHANGKRIRKENVDFAPKRFAARSSVKKPRAAFAARGFLFCVRVRIAFLQSGRSFDGDGKVSVPCADFDRVACLQVVCDHRLCDERFDFALEISL